MALVRWQLEQKKTKDLLLAKIDQSIDLFLSELFDIVSRVLGNSLESGLFQFLWEKWTSLALDEFTPLELNQYYQSYQRQQPHLISEYSGAAPISPIRQTIITRFIDFHFTLLFVRQGVRRFNQADAPFEMADLLAQCREKDIRITHHLLDVSADELRSSRYVLYNCITVLQACLLSAAYLKLDRIEPLEDERHLLMAEEVEHLERVLRAKLPPIDKLNKQIQFLHDSGSSANSKRQAKQCLNEFIQDLGDSLDVLKGSLLACQNMEEELQRVLANHHDIQQILEDNKVFKVVTERVKDLDNLHQTATTLLNVSAEVAEFADSQSYLPRGIYTSEWARLASYVRASTTRLGTYLQEVIDLYSDYQDEMRFFAELSERLQPVLDQQSHEVTLLTMRLAQARYCLEESVQRVEANRNELRAHLEGTSTTFYLTSFVQRHWPKMLTGGLGGTATGTTLGLVLAMSQPVTFSAILLGNLVIGGALGAGVGVVTDISRKEAPKETTPLLDPKTVQMALSKSIRNDDHHESTTVAEKRSLWPGWMFRQVKKPAKGSVNQPDSCPKSGQTM